MKKCVIYTRTCTKVGQTKYNSCESQKRRVFSFIKNQKDLRLVKSYSDPGYSGANLNRPSIQRLLKDLREKQIDVVLTSDTARLTRSFADFRALVKFFKKHGTAYVCIQNPLPLNRLDELVQFNQEVYS